jgi:O-acetyl-ADP-ribose deacetylase (regulator of RNase III)
MKSEYLLAILAFIILIAGIALYFWQVRGKTKYFETTNVITWLLIALFPTLILYAFFPSSSTSGTLMGFTVTGAVGLFILVWVYGTRTTNKASAIDDLTKKAEDLQAALDKAQPGGRKGILIQETKVYRYALKSRKSKRIALITGDIQKVKQADIWVNTENTNMQMARFFDNSISAVIRYLGAKRDQLGNVTEDSIANELKQVMGNNNSVHPTTIIVTGAGELEKSNNVKKIFHAAAAQGVVGKGYSPVENIEYCVSRALEIANEGEMKDAPIKSILFPLMGAGTAKGDTKVLVAKLLQAAINFMDVTGDNKIDTVYFLTRTDMDLEVCQEVLGQSAKLTAER